MKKVCYDGHKCQIQDKKVCEHACAARVQAPVAATLNACTGLVAAIGRHHDAQLATTGLVVTDQHIDEVTETFWGGITPEVYREYVRAVIAKAYASSAI